VKCEGCDGKKAKASAAGGHFRYLVDLGACDACSGSGSVFPAAAWPCPACEGLGRPMEGLKKDFAALPPWIKAKEGRGIWNALRWLARHQAPKGFWPASLVPAACPEKGCEPALILIPCDVGVTALALLAGGCSRVIVSDVQAEKLAIAGAYPNVIPVDARTQDLAAVVRRETDGWGADIVAEASGSERVYASLLDCACPGGCVVLVGIPLGPVSFNVAAAQAKEVRMETVFRYAHVYPRAVALMGSGKIDLKPLITDVYPFARSVEAFDYAKSPRPTSVKVQITMTAAGR